MEVYDRRYWSPRRLGELRHQVMADEIFEFTINADPANSRGGIAVRTAQEAANDILEAAGMRDRLNEDGIVGFQTLSVLNSLGSLGELHRLAWQDRFNLLQLRYYRNLRRDLVNRFLRGWTRRVI